MPRHRQPASERNPFRAPFAGKEPPRIDEPHSASGRRAKSKKKYKRFPAVFPRELLLDVQRFAEYWSREVGIYITTNHALTMLVIAGLRRFNMNLAEASVPYGYDADEDRLRRFKKVAWSERLTHARIVRAQEYLRAIEDIHLGKAKHAGTIEEVARKAAMTWLEKPGEKISLEKHYGPVEPQ